MAETEAQAPATAAPVEQIQPAEQKLKVKKPRQRACDEKDAKGKVCCGHLKRWYDYPADIEARVGKHAELYRCENCQTLYLPDKGELPRSFTHRY